MKKTNTFSEFLNILDDNLDLLEQEYVAEKDLAISKLARKLAITYSAATLLYNKRTLAKKNHLEFMLYTWQNTQDKFIIGEHTLQICAAIDKAFENYRNGISSFLTIKVPFRHGKSDIGSRYLPAHFLGEFPNSEVLLASYSFGKSQEFSKFGRRLVRDTEEYKELYPDIELAKDSQAVAEWEITNKGEQTLGKAQFVGLGGSITGKGGSLIIVDDFCAGRQEAESSIKRDSTWNSFVSDVLTRRAPVSIVIVLATPWHKDDLFGRIKQKEIDDTNFPKFKELRFPAFSEKYTNNDNTLFPERFSRKWYDSQKASLGVYGTASLLQCEPTVKGGTLLKTDNIQIVDNFPINENELVFVRSWDLASSEKQRNSDDPDFTVGVKVAVTIDTLKLEHGADIEAINIYIDDVIRGQWEAPKRNKIIIEAAIKDGDDVKIGVESFGPYKDAYTTLKDIIGNFRTIKKMLLPGDKIAKASILEAPFELGRVWVKRASWNTDFIQCLSEFPRSNHDDDVDATALGVHLAKNSGARLRRF